MEKKGKENKEKLQTSIKSKKFPHVFLFFPFFFLLSSFIYFNSYLKVQKDSFKPVAICKESIERLKENPNSMKMKRKGYKYYYYCYC